MRKTIFLFLAAATVLFNSCKPTEKAELVGKWSAEKIIFDGVECTDAECVQFVHFQFNADGTCIFNIEGYEGDDVEANYVFNNNKITLTIDDDGDVFVFVVSVEKLTKTELVLNIPPLEEDDPVCVVHYRKV